MSIVMRRLRYALAVSSALFLGMLISEGLEAQGQPTVVELTQMGCQSGNGDQCAAPRPPAV